MTAIINVGFETGGQSMATGRTCRVCGSNTHVDLNGRRMSNKCTRCQADNLHWGQYTANGANKFERYEDNGDIHKANCGVARPKTTPAPQQQADDSIQQDDAAPAPVGGVTHAELKVVADEVAIVRNIMTNQEAKQDSILQVLSNLPTKATFQQYETKDKEIEQRFKALTQARPLSITLPNTQAINVGRQHYMFPNLLATMLAVRKRGVPFMVGEPGSFKTAIVYAVAQALGLSAEVVPVGMQTSKSDLIGYMNAGGTYVDTAIYRTYVNGGVCLIDEIDAANPNVLTIINSILANDEAGFPNGQHKRHDDCHFLVAGNTFGKGADVQFVGRAQLDQATLNRFVYLPFDTDWGLVGDIMGVPVTPTVSPYPDPLPNGRDASDPLVQGWAQYVKDIHDILEREEIRATIGSRSVLTGVPMLMAGIDADLVEYATIRAHLSPDQWDLVKQHLPQRNGTHHDKVEAAAPIESVGPYWLRIADIPTGGKLAAIKVVRETTGMGLKEAKDAVEQQSVLFFQTDERVKWAAEQFRAVNVEVQYGQTELAPV